MDILAFRGFCTFTGVYTAIYMGSCRRSYILLVQKFQTSEMLDKWSPTSKLSHIKFPHNPDGRYIFSLVREPACPPNLLNLFLDIFNYFPLFITIKFWALTNILTSCQFRCKSATAYVLHNFSNVLSDWYFSWLYLNFYWLSSCGVFFAVHILLVLRKKDREKSLQKMFLQTQPDIFVHILFKGKMQFFSVGVSWCDVLPLFLYVAFGQPN